MATDPTKFERLRNVGLLEKLQTARHSLRHYFNLIVTASYTLPDTYTLPLKDYVYKAVETAILEHPVFSAIPLGEETKDPYFVRLPEVDLGLPVSFQKTDQPLTVDGDDKALQSLLEKEHDTGFEVPRPCWRLVILTSADSDKHFSASFVYHHGIGDGLSGTVFQRTFLRGLREAASLKAGEVKQVVPPPKVDLLPPLEDLNALYISYLYIFKVLLIIWFFVTPGPNHWAGGPFRMPVETTLRMFVLPAEKTSAFVKACRAHNTTVSCALMAAVARSIFAHIPEKYTRIKGTLPLSSRPWCSAEINNDSFGNWAQVWEDFFTRASVEQDKVFPWNEALRARKITDREIALKGKNTSVGLFKYAKDFHKELCDPNLGKPRLETFEMPSLGVVKTEDSGNLEIPQMHRAVLTNGSAVVSAALLFTAVTGPDGCLSVGLSWQSGVVEVETAEGVLETVRTLLEDVSQ